MLLTAGVYTSGEFRASGTGYTKRLLAIVISTPDPARRLLICSCEGTMPLDADAVGRGCRLDTISATHLCGAELNRFKTIAAEYGPLTVGCTQQATLFSDVAAEIGRKTPLQFANIRESAGWSSEAKHAGPKMAALLAAAAEPVPPTPLVELQSGGVILICGRDETAVEAANLLKDHLDVTVLVEPPASIAPPGRAEFPVAKGKVRGAKGHLGAFEITVDDFAEAAPSSRQVLIFGPSRDSARSNCDIILDLTGGAALFSAADLRDGYLRAVRPIQRRCCRPSSKPAISSAPSRSRGTSILRPACALTRVRTGRVARDVWTCALRAPSAPQGEKRRCRDQPQYLRGLRPMRGRLPYRRGILCVAAEDALMRRLRAMLMAFREAGGERAVVLLHDEAHGTPLIDALARFGDGLPANVLPFAVNEVTQAGLEAVIAAFAYGTSAMRFLLRGKSRHDVAGLSRTIAVADPILVGLGFGAGRISTIETDDPDDLLDALRKIPPLTPAPRPASFRAVGKKRDVLRFALGELHRSAPAPVDVIALPRRRLQSEQSRSMWAIARCACPVYSACPTGALRDDPERPVLRFVEGVPACSVASARRPVPRKSSRCCPGSILVPRELRRASSKRKSRSAASGATNHSV